MKLSTILEAILAASAQPISAHDLARDIRARAATLHERMTREHPLAESVEKSLYAGHDDRLRAMELLCRTDSQDVSDALAALQLEYESQARGISLQSHQKGWQLVTRADLADFITTTDTGVKKMPMAFLECLAMVAYRQPISKAAIEAVRGVPSSSPLQKLHEMKLIEASGTSDLPGNQPLFITTKEFLDHFGIPNLEALPKVAELRVAPLEPKLPDEMPLDGTEISHSSETK